MCEYKLNTILWIEDEIGVIQGLLDYFYYSDEIKNTYGSEMGNIISEISSEVSEDNAASEIEMLVRGAGDEPKILVVKTAQIARTYLEHYLPGVIICDSNFPLNGKEVIEWLKANGLKEYPLIGFSGRAIDDLEPELKNFFVTTNSRYFNKGSIRSDQLINAAIFSRQYVSYLSTCGIAK